MAGRDVFVERVRNGGRDVVAEVRVPADAEVLLLEEPDHVHVVLGTHEELVGIGLAKAKPVRKPRKPAAKKSMAKKSTAKKKG